MPASPLNPSPSFLRRILGEPNVSSLSPEIQQAWATQQILDPQTTAKVSHIGSMGPFSRFKAPDAYAQTGPLGNIQFNEANIRNDKQDPADVLSHELAHVKQGTGGFLRKFYDPTNSVENEAVNAESMRPVRREDVALRPPIRKLP